jgi:hypothetical protein
MPYGMKWQPNQDIPVSTAVGDLFHSTGFSFPACRLHHMAGHYFVDRCCDDLFAACALAGIGPAPAVGSCFRGNVFFGPMYLTLHAGSVGAIALLALLAAILLLEKDKSLLAGIMLSLTMLKPPQGVPILFLAGIWFLARRDWKAIYGVAIGGIALLLIGMIQERPKIPHMNFKPAYPMVPMTMAMRMMRMEMFCCAKWKAR